MKTLHFPVFFMCRSRSGSDIYAYLADRDAPEMASQPRVTMVTRPQQPSEINTLTKVTKVKPVTKKKPDEPVKPETSSGQIILASSSSFGGKPTLNKQTVTGRIQEKDGPGTASFTRWPSGGSTVSSASSRNEDSQGSMASRVGDLPDPSFSLQPGTFDVVLCVDKREHFGG